MTASEEIRQAILKRWPCQAVPRGTQRALAREFGVSPELVRLQLNRLGYQPTAPVDRDIYLCIDCGKEVTAKARDGRCPACRKKANLLDLICDHCGKTFQRTLSERTNAMGNPNHNGGTFCSRKCFHAWQGPHMSEVRKERHWRSGWAARPAKPYVHGERRTYNNGCRCEPCRAARHSYDLERKARKESE